MKVASDFESLMAGMGVKRMDDSKGQKPKTVKRRPSAKSKPSAKPSSADVVREATDRSAELERALAHIKDERAAAEAKVATLQKRVKRLKKQVSAAEAELAKPRPTVAQVLTDWGFETAAERAQVFERQDWLERIISEPDLLVATELREAVTSGWARV